MKFRKKPIVVDAVQVAIEWFTNPALAPSRVVVDPGRGAVLVKTSEGVMKAVVGDWIISGIKGEKYPIKDDIFRQTYEEIVDA